MVDYYHEQISMVNSEPLDYDFNEKEQQESWHM